MTDRGVKSPSDSCTYIAEIVGEESLRGERMTAGKLLQMMDMAAGAAAWRHCRSPLVTFAFDRIELLQMICHMDYVRYDASVIQVGHSSMVVKVEGYAKSPTEMQIRPANNGVITMIAIDENRRPTGEIPGLEYVTPDDLERKRFAEARERLLQNRKRMRDRIDAMESVPDEALQDFHPRNNLVTPERTRLEIRKIFLPRNMNRLGIVFGGDTIQLMEELALANARQFTGNFRMVTIAMEDVYFLKPLRLNHLVEMSSMAIFVGDTTMVVEVTVTGYDPWKPDEEGQVTNKGLFTILNYDRSNRKKKITTGLNLAGSDPEVRRGYLKEQTKYKMRRRASGFLQGQGPAEGQH